MIVAATQGMPPMIAWMARIFANSSAFLGGCQHLCSCEHVDSNFCIQDYNGGIKYVFFSDLAVAAFG